MSKKICLKSNLFNYFCFMNRRLLLIIIFISAFFYSFSQINWLKPNTGYFKYNGLEADSVLVPALDTLQIAPAGSIAVKNGLFYVKGTYWNLVSGSGGGTNIATAQQTAIDNFDHDWAGYDLKIHSLRNLNFGFINPSTVYDDEPNNIANGLNKIFVVGRYNQIGGGKDNFFIGTKNVDNTKSSQFHHFYGDENYIEGDDNTKIYSFGSTNAMFGNSSNHCMMIGFKSQLFDNNKNVIDIETDGDGGFSNSSGVLYASSGSYNISNNNSTLITGSRNNVSNLSHSVIIGKQNNLTISDYDLYVLGSDNKHISGVNTPNSFMIGRGNRLEYGKGVYAFGHDNIMETGSYAIYSLMFGNNNKIYATSYHAGLYGNSNRIYDVGVQQMAFGAENNIGNFSECFLYGRRLNSDCSNETVIGYETSSIKFGYNSHATMNGNFDNTDGMAFHNGYSVYSTGYSPSYSVTYDPSYIDGNYTQIIPSVSGFQCFKVNGYTADSNGNIDVPTPADQVNSDWAASSGVSQILNKPNIPVIVQSNSYSTTYTSSAYTAYTVSTAEIYTAGTSNVNQYRVNISGTYTGNRNLIFSIYYNNGYGLSSSVNFTPITTSSEFGQSIIISASTSSSIMVNANFYPGTGNMIIISNISIEKIF